MKICLFLLLLLSLVSPSAWAVTNGVLIHGSVLYPTQTTLSTANQPGAVAMADLDGDGFQDVIVRANAADKIVWYRNNGNGTFGTTEYFIATFTASVGSIYPADLDLDGRIDVVYWDGSTRIKWSRNVGGALSTGLFNYNAGTPLANQTEITGVDDLESAVFVADLNNDTFPDVVFVSKFPANRLAWCRNLGGGTFNFDSLNPTANQNVILNPGTSPNAVRGTDLDGDGFVDLIVTLRNDSRLAWFKNGGVGTVPTFTKHTIATVLQGPQSPAAADIDGDGYPDLLCAATTTSRVNWFHNDTHTPGAVSPFFTFGGVVAGEVVSVTGFSPGNFAVGDLNSDGRMDVLCASSKFPTGNGKLFWCKNLGSGNFNFVSATPTSNQTLPLISATVSDPFSVAIADFQLDGVPDVVAASTATARVYDYVNFGGQVALAGLDTAPATLMEGKRDDLVRIAVSNRGETGDNSAQIATLGLLFEKSAGVAMTSAEANAVIDSLHLYLDTNSSGVFELGTDTLVASLADLTLTAGRQVFTVSPGTPADAQVAPLATRNFFVVPKIATLGASQTPNTFRVTHLSTGTGRSTFKDALNPTIGLTLETLSIANTTSAFVTAVPAHTYDDHTYIYFDSNSAPGTGPLDDYDLDTILNLTEFGFGSDPTVSGSAAMVVTGGVLVQRGQPTVLVTNTQTGVTFQALFCRRKDPLALLTYTVQFSATLSSWVSSAATPTVLADDGVFEAVAVPYPFFVNGRKARFFRVVVSTP